MTFRARVLSSILSIHIGAFYILLRAATASSCHAHVDDKCFFLSLCIEKQLYSGESIHTHKQTNAIGAHSLIQTQLHRAHTHTLHSVVLSYRYVLTTCATFHQYFHTLTQCANVVVAYMCVPLLRRLRRLPRHFASSLFVHS